MMNVEDLHIHIHVSHDADRKLHRKLKRLTREQALMNERIASIQEQVTQQGTLITDLRAVIDTKQAAIAAAFAAQEAKIADLNTEIEALKAAGADTTALEAIAAGLAENNAMLADGKTDVEDTPVPPVEEEQPPVTDGGEGSEV